MFVRDTAWRNFGIPRVPTPCIHPFDENIVFKYLGTTAVRRNPGLIHSSEQQHAFALSITYRGWQPGS